MRCLPLPPAKWRTPFVHAMIGGAVLSFCLLTAGCAWSVGGQKGGTVIEPTQGQQLIDLKKAYDDGAITEPEYDKLKARILGGH